MAVANEINLVALMDSGWTWRKMAAKDVRPGDIHHPTPWSTPCTVESIGYGCAGVTVLNLKTENGTQFGVGFDPNEETAVWAPVR